MATKASDWTGVTVSDGRYLVKAKLGEGGMGIVYRAQDTRLGMDVVIKVPRSAMLDDPEFAGRFASEIRSLVKLSHPCIVKVTDVGQYGGLPFAIMQYLPGGSLEDRQPAAVDPKTVPGWLEGVASALDYIHTQGYVHRDVKPGNILFDSHGYAFLADFGVIKALAATEGAKAKSVTGAGLVLGTPEYMAPELIMGGKVDGRADQYALAVTVYEMLCGRRPFEGSTSTAVLVMHTTQPPPLMNEFRPSLPDRLSQAVLKALAKDPAQRYPTCAEFAAAVIAALEASPAAAAAVAAPKPASADSVKIQCPSCGKKVAMSVSIYGTLKSTGKKLSCPGCHEPIDVASPRTQVLRAPGRDSGATSAGTQKLAAMGPGRAAGQGPAGGPARTTEKIEIPNLVLAEETELAPKGRATTQILGRGQTQILTAHADPSPAKPSPLPWIGAGVAASLMLASAFVFWPRPSTEGTVRIQLPPSAATASIDLDQRSYTFADLSKPLTLPMGSHLLTVSQAGYEPYAKTFVVSADASSQLDVSLNRKPKPKPEQDPLPAKRPAPPRREIARADNPTKASPDGDVKPPQPAASEDFAAQKPEPLPQASAAPDDATPGNPASKDPVVVSKKPAQPDTKTSRAKASGPSTPAKPTELTLTEIVKSPEKYDAQDTTLSKLYTLGPNVTFEPNGTASFPAVQSLMTVSNTGAIASSPKGAAATLEVESGLAERIIAKDLVRRNGQPPQALPRGVPDPGPFVTVAILTVRAARSQARYAANAWVIQLVSAEFLVNLNLARISDRKYNNAFVTYTLGNGFEGKKVGDPAEWTKRLDQHFLVNAGKAYKIFKSQMSMAKNAMINTMIGNMVGETVNEMEAASAAATQQQLKNATPKKAFDTPGFYDSIQEQNAAARARGAEMTAPP